MDKSLDYKYFLFGIVVFWMFDTVWASFSPFFFALEAIMNPIAVIIGMSILMLTVIYLLFRKVKFLNIKWIHIVILIAFLVVMGLLDYFLLNRFFELHSIQGNMMDRDIPNFVMQNVRKWSNLVTSLLMITFLWWKYDSEDTKADSEISICESRSYYGGMLFTIIFGYILYSIRLIGGDCWIFVHHPMLIALITYLLLILVTVYAVYMLVKKRIIVFPLAVILAVVAIHFFSSHYLYNILLEHFPLNDIYIQHVAFFDNVASCCDWTLFLVAFVLYRKELNQNDNTSSLDS